VGRGGVEPPTFHFSGGRSYQLSYLPEQWHTIPEGRASYESGGAAGCDVGDTAGRVIPGSDVPSRPVT
jgi:hypothetical protein